MELCVRCDSNKREGRYLTCTSCRKKPWQQYKKDSCKRCGFIPVWKGQLDVDHIDGDKTHNDPANLQTLCANCHRLKTHENRDYI